MKREVALSTVWPAMRGAERRLTVRGLCMDSADVRPGFLFLAVPGQVDDGRRHIAESLRLGAKAVFAESHGAPAGAWPDADAPIVAVPGLRPRISAMAARFFGDPSASLWLVGVTGTKGKTSCAWLISEALRALGSTCGLIGTLGTRCGDGPLRALERTTPDPVTVQRLLAEQRRRGAEAVVMEVSSHALAQSRVAAVRFDVAVFTNLGAEHLEYHLNEAAYLHAKCRLFQSRNLRYAIFNADDPHAAALAASAGGAERVGVGLGKTADCRAHDIEHRLWGISARIETPWGRGRLSVPLPGEFNLRNALCALCALCAGGWPLDMVTAALAASAPPPGRMQAVHGTGDDIAVVVDYAHTAESLRAALTALRDARLAGRLWCVFGAGGDRYAGKRPDMGRCAAELADVLVLSSDNPRSESPERIVDDIMAGVATGVDVEVRVEPDRAAAIEMAVVQARAGDAVLIAGKGHERHQQTGAARAPFSDARAAVAALRRRRGASLEVAL